MAATLYTQGFGSRPENVEIPVVDIRDPTSFDNTYPIGKRWINTATPSHWTLVNLSTSNGIVTATWIN